MEKSSLMENTKLPNTDSFRMVLEFIFISFRQFKPLLSVLNPSGPSFYRKHVKSFNNHIFDQSKLFMLCSFTPIKNLGWHPRPDTLTAQVLTKHRLECLKYRRSHGLCCLTFVFSNNVQSPPQGTYYEQSLET